MCTLEGGPCWVLRPFLGFFHNPGVRLTRWPPAISPELPSSLLPHMREGQRRARSCSCTPSCRADSAVCLWGGPFLGHCATPAWSYHCATSRCFWLPLMVGSPLAHRVSTQYFMVNNVFFFPSLGWEDLQVDSTLAFHMEPFQALLDLSH